MVSTPDYVDLVSAMQLQLSLLSPYVVSSSKAKQDLHNDADASRTARYHAAYAL